MARFELDLSQVVNSKPSSSKSICSHIAFSNPQDTAFQGKPNKMGLLCLQLWQKKRRKDPASYKEAKTLRGTKYKFFKGEAGQRKSHVFPY